MEKREEAGKQGIHDPLLQNDNGTTTSEDNRQQVS